MANVYLCLIVLTISVQYTLSNPGDASSMCTMDATRMTSGHGAANLAGRDWTITAPATYTAGGAAIAIGITGSQWEGIAIFVLDSATHTQHMGTWTAGTGTQLMACGSGTNANAAALQHTNANAKAPTTWQWTPPSTNVGSVEVQAMVVGAGGGQADWKILTAVTVAGTGGTGGGTGGGTSNPPNPPTITNVQPGNGKIVVSFTPGATVTGVTVDSYTATATPPNGPAVGSSGATSPITITELTPNTAYTVAIVARSSAGVYSTAATYGSSVTPTGGAVSVNGSFLFTSPNSDFTVQWKINGASLTITMSGATTGWISAGVSHGPTMSDNADYWLGWVTAGTTKLVDCFSNTENTALDDATMVGGRDTDLTLVSGSEVGATTSIVFTRLLDTGDTKGDTVIGDFDLYLHWAYQSADGTLTGNTPSYNEHDVADVVLVNFITGTSQAVDLNTKVDTGQAMMLFSWLIIFVYAAIYNGRKAYRRYQKEQLVRKSMAAHKVGSDHEKVRNIPLVNESGETAEMIRWRAQWAACKDDQGNTFFYNASTKESSWEIPPLPDYFAPRGSTATVASMSPGKSGPTPTISAKQMVDVKKNVIYNTATMKALGWWNRRIPYTQISVGHILMLIGFVLLCLVCFAIDTTRVTAHKWGSLAIAVTLLCTVVATRNSVLVWMLGFPFDRIIVFHRWLGRILFLVSTIHAGMEWQWFKDNGQDITQTTFHTGHQNYFGFWAWFLLIPINIMSLDYFRRKFFTLFYYTHFLFLLFFIMCFYHVAACTPYLIGICVLYGLDRFIRLMWGIIPYKTVSLEAKEGNILKVQFPKAWLARKLNLYKVGQYVFVNFPQLNLFEWHPFSISSAPEEITGELHIRSLGKYTKKLYSYVKESQASQLYVRIDGPYGYHRKDYRRYPVLMLCSGGIGVTPLVSILKDIYHVGNFPPGHSTKPHKIEAIYAIWIIPDTINYKWFQTEFDQIWAASQDPRLPVLNLWVYVTREKPENIPGDSHMVAGRPDFDSIFNLAAQTYPGRAKMAFACGPEAMVNTIWDTVTASKLAGNRFDFIHETFEW